MRHSKQRATGEVYPYVSGLVCRQVLPVQPLALSQPAGLFSNSHARCNQPGCSLNCQMETETWGEVFSLLLEEHITTRSKSSNSELRIKPYVKLFTAAVLTPSLEFHLELWNSVFLSFTSPITPE